MVEIGDRPILWHIMKAYGATRLQRFHPLPGLQELGTIKQYFLRLHLSTAISR